MLPNRQNFCCDNLWISIIVATENPGKLGEFFSLTFVATLVNVLNDEDRLVISSVFELVAAVQLLEIPSHYLFPVFCRYH